MRGPVAWALAGCALLAALTLAAIGLERTPPAPPLAAALSVAEAMAAGPVEGFQRVLVPRAFDFPADHGAHAGFRTEWWYFTGTLFAADGRALGYQLTFFRNALVPHPPRTGSSLRAGWVWMAHFALSDERRGLFRSSERFAREALGLAGAEVEPFRVWVETWEALSTSAPFSPLALRAAAEGLEIDLRLEPEKGIVLQGDGGLSAKGPEPGNASYYYSMPRLATRGTVALDGERFEVEGLSWLDREWSTSALGPDLAGWDWLALQLDDGRDLMLYRLRRRDGRTGEFSGGSLVAADGTSRQLGARDFTLEARGNWRSPRGGIYPASFRISVPSEQLALEAVPRVADQELDALVRYWEGAVRVRGSDGAGPVTGVGFLEMTGYAEAALERDAPR